MPMEETIVDGSIMEVDAEAEPQAIVPEAETNSSEEEERSMLILETDQICLELEKFLHEKWFAIEFWEKVIQFRMQQAYSETNILNGKQQTLKSQEVKLIKLGL